MLPMSRRVYAGAGFIEQPAKVDRRADLAPEFIPGDEAERVVELAGKEFSRAGEALEV